MNYPELAANAFNAASVVLAGRNSVHTWWTGIVGCVAFFWVFFAARLYGDATLQVFFVATSVVGWVHWSREGESAGPTLEVRSSSTRRTLAFTAAGLVFTACYAWLLGRFTDAAAPVLDSAVLGFSVTAQLLLMGRRVETWWFWLLVNTIAVPLFFSRGLHLTAMLYGAFWVNALISLRHWRKLVSVA